MDAKFQASFIPKTPVSPSEGNRFSHISLLSLISLIIFIVAIGLGGGVALAKYMLGKKITELNQHLSQAKASFELSTVKVIKRSSQRIEAAKVVLDKHIAFSEFFALLERVTYQNVAFSDFNYDFSPDGIKATLSGTALTFNSLELQAEAFKQITSFTNQTYDSFSLDKEGRVAFHFSAIVDPKLINYKQKISASATQ